MVTRSGRPSRKSSTRKQACAGLLPNVDGAALRGHYAELRQKKPRSDHRMTREPQLALRRENAQPGESLRVRGLSHKNRLAKIHFARDIEHAPRTKTISIRDNCKRISRERRVGENIKLVQALFHFVSVKYLSADARESRAADVEMMPDCRCFVEKMLAPRSETNQKRDRNP